MHYFCLQNTNEHIELKSMDKERNNNISALFDSWAGVKRGEDMAKGHDELVEGVLRKWEFEPTDYLLDVGCGNGRALTLAKDHGAKHFAGIDASPGMIEQAQQNISPADLKVGSGEALPWLENTFTHVISIEAFYYLENPLNGFKEIRRVLKPDGKIAVAIEFYQENKGSHVWQENLPFNIHLLSESAWKDLMEEAGFTDIKIERIVREKNVKDVANFNPTPFFPSYEIYLDYMQCGALMLSN